MNIKRAKSAGDLPKAITLFKEMKTNQIKPNDYLLTTMISIYGETNQLSKSFELFNLIKNIDIITYNSILSACKMCNNINDAWLIFIKLSKNQSIKPDKITKKLLNAMFINNEKINSYLSRSSISKLCNYWPIVQFSINMDTIHITNGFGVNYTSINTKIDKLSSGLVSNLIKQTSIQTQYPMHAEKKAIASLLHFDPDRNTYSVSLLNIDICDDCHVFFEHLSNKYENIKFNINCCDMSHHVFCNGYCSCNNNKKDNKLIINKTDSKSIYKVTKELREIINKKQFLSANKLWLNMYSQNESSLNTVSYSIILKSLLMNKCLTISDRMNRMNEIIQQMFHLNIFIDYGICGILLNIYNSNINYIDYDHNESNKFKLEILNKYKYYINWIWNHLLSSNQIIKCNLSIYNMLINLCGYFNEKQTMKDVFNYIISSDIIPDHYTFNTLLSYQTNAEDFNHILYLMETQYKLDRNIVTFNIMLSVYSSIDIDSYYHSNIVSILNDDRFIADARTFGTLLKNATIYLNDELSEECVYRMINNDCNITGNLLYPFTVAINYYSKRNNIAQFNSLLIWWFGDLHLNKFSNYSNLDIPSIVSLIGAFGHFRQYDNIQYLIEFSRKQFGRINKIEKVYVKSFHQQFLFDNNDNNYNNIVFAGMGDINSTKTLINLFIKISSTFKYNNEKLKFDCSIKHILDFVSSNSNDNININNDNISSCSAQCTCCFTPFSYLFSSICGNPCSNILDVINILNQISCELFEMKSKCVINEYYLLPTTICLLTTFNNKIFIGFSCSTIQSLRSMTYKNILNKLPLLIKNEVNKFVNDININNDNTLNHILSNNIKEIKIFKLDWNNENKNMKLYERGMCLTCNQIFTSLKSKCSHKATNSSNYVLHCAEWEAIIRFYQEYQTTET